ncbi:MAG TPA: trehalase family glycosidase, partial [Candidatus Saccharimonadales bacterium]|nr:trehalase family glycosidase [Candidatus Saccharimonadales bacterium]
SIATLLPLYSGAIAAERAEHLAKLLNKRSQFKASSPVPSVPLDSPYFNATKYWQGPTWINMNWLIIDGLKHYGFKDEAEKLRDKTIKMVEASGCYEYFSPLDGSPAGAENFSWTAALTIDLLKQN